METNFNFKSQICTTREQSELLLALGLKKETADMCWIAMSGGYYIYATPWSCHSRGNDIPAWSLHRLIEMMPSPIKLKEDLPTFHPYAFLKLSQVAVSYTWEDYDCCDRQLVGFYGNGLFAAVVDAIEWLIKEEYFNKEYLV